MIRRAAAALACAFFVACAGFGARREASMQWNGSYSSSAAPAGYAAENADQWGKIWTMIGSPAPDVDFSKNFAAAVFLGTRSTGGYGVVFLPPAVEGGKLVVTYKVKKPEGFVSESLTQPWAARLFPKPGRSLPIEIREAR